METIASVEYGLIAERWSIVALLVALPLIVHLRASRPSRLFACATLCFGGVAVYGIASGMDQLSVRSAIGSSLFMGIFTLLVFMQERFGGMVFPRITKALFWIALIGTLMFYWVPVGVLLLPDPLSTDLAASAEAIDRLMMVKDISSGATLSAYATLVLAAPLSWVVAWRRR